MTDNAHNLEFTVLSKPVSNSGSFWDRNQTMAYLETLILEHALDGRILARGGKLGLEYDTERTVANNLALGILEISGFASQSILDALTDHLCDGVSTWAKGGFCCEARGPRSGCLPPIRKLLNAPGRCDDMLQESGPIGASNTIECRRKTTYVVYQGGGRLWGKPCWATGSWETRVKTVRCDATYASEGWETVDRRNQGLDCRRRRC